MPGPGSAPLLDEDWGEYLFDVSTPEKRAELLSIVGPWIEGCAADGFDAIEVDNLDSSVICVRSKVSVPKPLQQFCSRSARLTELDPSLISLQKTVSVLAAAAKKRKCAAEAPGTEIEIEACHSNGNGVPGGSCALFPSVFTESENDGRAPGAHVTFRITCGEAALSAIVHGDGPAE